MQATVIELSLGSDFNAEYHHSSLQSELAQVQGRELRLESARLGLEGAVGCLRTELQASQGQVEERGRELTKARAHQHSMEKKNKVGAFYFIICMGRGGGYRPNLYST